jgi:hypothetical protein
VNAVFSGNGASQEDGGGLNLDVTTASISNATFSSNVAADMGGGVFVGSSGGLLIQNSILWRNQSGFATGENAQIWAAGASLSIDASIVEGWTGALCSCFATDEAPVFVDLDGPDGVAGTADDDLRLTSDSPGIDWGNNSIPTDFVDVDGDGDSVEPVPVDLDDQPRIADDPLVPEPCCLAPPVIDLGPYERQPVEADGDGDAVPDSRDNCTDVPNSDQYDANLDGYGNACDADFDDNGSVGLSDFNRLREQFGRRIGSPGFDSEVDLDHSGAIGIADFNSFRSRFGGSPGPSGLECAGAPGGCPAPL